MFAKNLLTIVTLAFALSAHAAENNYSGSHNSHDLAAAASCDVGSIVTKTVTVTAAAATSTGTDNSSSSKGSSSSSAGSSSSKGSSSSSKGSSSNGSSSSSKGSSSTGSSSSDNGSSSKGSSSSSSDNGSSSKGSSSSSSSKGSSSSTSSSSTGSSSSSKSSTSSTSTSSGSSNNSSSGSSTDNSSSGSSSDNSSTGTSTSSTTTITTSATPDNSDPQQSTTLNPAVVCTGFQQNGQAVQEAGQVPSLVSNNNFINFCLTQPNLPLTNGQQITTGSCNPAPIGAIPSTANMPSTKFSTPSNFGTVQANTNFTIAMNIARMVTGNFVNAQTNYYSAPQQLSSNGQIIGHTHVTIQEVNGFQDSSPPDPTVFAFFKGINTAAVNGAVSALVSPGLAVGTYRACSINAAANHQPVILPVAQHGNSDDCVYFEATADGQPSDAANAINGNAAGSAAGSSTSASASASASAAATDSAAATVSATGTAVVSAFSSAAASGTAIVSVASDSAAATGLATGTAVVSASAAAATGTVASASASAAATDVAVSSSAVASASASGAAAKGTSDTSKNSEKKGKRGFRFAREF